MEKPPPKQLLTRQTWAAYLLPSALLAAILGGTAAWLTGQPKFAATPLGVLALWAVLHFMTPRQGQSHATVRGTPGAPTLLWFLGAALLWMAALLGIDFYLFDRTIHDPLQLYHVAVFLPPFLLIFVGAHLADRLSRADQRDTDGLPRADSK